MEKYLSVLLIEDDKKDCNEFVKLIDESEDIRLIGVTSNEKKALEYVKDHIPDVIILDLELHKGSGNGISFLEELNEICIQLSLFILVTTNNVSRITHERVRQLGADFIMVKCQEDYSAESVVEFLRSIKMTIQEIKDKTKEKANTPEISDKSPGEIKKRQEIRTCAEIDNIGVSPKVLGRSYLVEAIMHKIDDKPDPYALIAKKHGKTNASVERAMQTAINKAWNSTSVDELLKHYKSKIHSDKGVPTVMEFICYYANKIRVEY